MTQLIHIASATSAGNPAIKDNEDRYCHYIDGARFGAAVCDGVSQRPLPDGTYPRTHGGVAANVVRQHLLRHFQQSGESTASLEDTILEASTFVRKYNEGVSYWNITDWSTYDRSATTVVCAIGERQTDGILTGSVLSLGDSLALAFTSQNEAPTALAPDQLTTASLRQTDMPWPDWVTWSRQTARNNPAIDDGYGVIDGNADFTHFVKIIPFTVPPGGVLLLGSDALRHLGSVDNTDDPTGYQWLTKDMLTVSLEDLPAHLISQTRQLEQAHKASPDDATVVIIKN